MAFYLTRFSYTPETWARLTKNPEDRRKAATTYIESVGGKLHGFWYAFGSYDGYSLWEAPDNVSMAAVAIAIGSGGALSKFETTVLLTVEKTLEALGRARSVSYRPPDAPPHAGLSRVASPGGDGGTRPCARTPGLPLLPGRRPSRAPRTSARSPGSDGSRPLAVPP